MSARACLTVLRIVLGLVLGGYSVALIVEQLHAGSHLPLLLLGLAELIAAILLLIPRTVRVGGVTFMIVLLAAVIFHVLHGEYSIGYLLVYAASTFAVLSTWKRI